jgi:class 3 adenylate cyclase
VRAPIKVKLLVLITLLLGLSVASLSAVQLRREQRALTAEMTKRGLTLAAALASSARNPVLTSDELALNLQVRDVLRDPDVVYVAVTDADGRTLAHGDIALVGKLLARPPALAPLRDETLVQTYSHPEHGRLIDIAVPLVFSQVRVGSVYLGFSLASVERARAAARNQAALVSAVMLLFGVAGALALATVLARPIRRLVAGTRAIADGNFDVTLAVPSRDEIGELTASFNRMAASLREKEAIKRAFSRYVTREVVDEILKNPERLALKEERRDVTVLFCDVRGFTSLAERSAPEAIVELVNSFYTLMIDAVFRHNGTVDKFLGDGAMAVFGAPIPDADHPERAVRAALALRAGIAELSQRRGEDGREPVAVGIGISTGEVVAGTVGTADRMEYTVLGDTVNLASRLESSASPGQILISRHTYELTAGVVEARALGALRVKGKQQQVEVYEVLGLRPP